MAASDLLDDMERAMAGWRASEGTAAGRAAMPLFVARPVHSIPDSRGLYGGLKIDEARAACRAEFRKSEEDRLKPGPQIPDYLHQEMVRALAQNDEALLGPRSLGPRV